MAEEKEFKPTFNYPDKFVRNEETGMSSVDKAGSEDYVLLEALGQPRVFYALKANRYFKDIHCTNEFTSAELEHLELPTPAAIAASRKKLLEECVDKGLEISRDDIYLATAPTELKVRRDLAGQILKAPTPEEKIIMKINKLTTGVK